MLILLERAESNFLQRFNEDETAVTCSKCSWNGKRKDVIQKHAEGGKPSIYTISITGYCVNCGSYLFKKAVTMNISTSDWIRRWPIRRRKNNVN